MTQKKNPQLKLVKPPSLEELKKMTRKYWTAKIKTGTTVTLLTAMVIFGTYLLITNHAFTSVYRTASYTKETSDNNGYKAFHNGIIRYSRDGVAFLNRKNEEIWIQPGQFKSPIIDISANTFAVGDSGGNSIQIFTEKGLKGEIETTLPIERMSISDQGIVSAILKNENMPMIVTYDATGNVLVENQVMTGSMGYPAALEMSPDGTVLAVSYLNVEGGVLKSKVICYNFGEKGKKAKNHQVSVEEYKDRVIPEIFFMDESSMVVVGDSSFAIYSGKDVPQRKRKLQFCRKLRVPSIHQSI